MHLELQRSSAELRERFSLLATARDVADLLEVPYDRLVYHIYRYPEDLRYRRFVLPKRGGGVREVFAPATHLKTLQRKLNRVLQVIYSAKPGAHGFVTGRSIVSNALLHTKRRFVFNADLVNFFPSIHFGRVRGVFMAHPYDLPAPAATVLAQICCHKSFLPQGAPTSPIVSNLICARLDGELQALARRQGCMYSRYADDITFSTNRRSFPRAIGCLVSIDSDVRVGVGVELEELVAKNGFQINHGKVRLRNRYERQEVTGLVVNERVNVSRRFVRQVRAMLHAWEKHGYAAAEGEFRSRWDGKSRRPGGPPVQFRDVVWGKIAFLQMVRGRDDSVAAKLRDWYDRLLASSDE